MNEKGALRVVPTPRAAEGRGDAEWAASHAQVVVGKDILELLSTSMYIDPMTIYREYIQNAADAIDEAREQRLLSSSGRATVDISIDATARSIRIRDNGTGIKWPTFVERLSNLGASVKRGTSARGFRGVGRLAGLGYCQELIFRSAAEGEQLVSELRWDCRALKSALRSAKQGQHLVALVNEVVATRRVAHDGRLTRFFEVELRGVVRHRNDCLLSMAAVTNYLAQVAPVPFAPDFSYGKEISAALRTHVKLAELEIRINGSERPVYRPHKNAIEFGEGNYDKVVGLELKELADLNGDIAAVAWVLHHGYQGAIPSKTLVKGIRLRSGNLQVGDHALLEELFPESRFNVWAVGEVHVLDKKILPNGRRDHFEQSVHFDNLLNQLTPIAREIAKHCRYSSIGRKWHREFETHQASAIDNAKAIARGGLSKSSRRAHTDSVAKSLEAMKKVLTTRHIEDEARATMATQSQITEARVVKLLGGSTEVQDPLENFRPPTRSAYQHIISLIYDCANSRAAASALVEKILGKLQEQSSIKMSRLGRKSGVPSRSRQLRKKSKGN
jgi:Histidine kinase-, DNA gyrase B-, and HSP90-like ATPase